MTFRALGRNHIASTPFSSHRNALFYLNSRIPLVRSSSELVVQRTGESAIANTFSRPQESRLVGSAVASSPLLATTSVVQETPRPNPQSQSLSRGYGSILPTSLIYIVLSTRGCTPWRPEAVSSTTRGANKSRHRIFTDRRERTGLDKEYRALPATEPYRRAIRFQGL